MARLSTSLRSRSTFVQAWLVFDHFVHSIGFLYFRGKRHLTNQQTYISLFLLYRNHSLSPLLFLQAMTSILLCSISFPVFAIRFCLRDKFLDFIGDSMCKIFPFIYYTNLSVYGLCLSMISINRLIAVLNYNLAQKVFTWKKCVAYFGIFWFISMMYFMLPLTGTWGEFGYEKETFNCDFKHEEHEGDPLGLFCALSFSMTLFSMILSFTVIRFVVHRRKNVINSSFSDSKVSQVYEAREKAITRHCYQDVFGNICILNRFKKN